MALTGFTLESLKRLITIVRIVENNELPKLLLKNKWYDNQKLDSIGWYVRKADLHRMVTAFDEVFTFHKDELDRFKDYLKKNTNDRKIFK